MAHEVTITKLSKGWLLWFMDNGEFKREAVLKQSEAFKRAKELLDDGN